jgi:hypothetical protein
LLLPSLFLFPSPSASSLGLERGGPAIHT